jgi:hypothetical protein
MVIVLSVAGCTDGYDVYDLSNSLPFSQYSGKDVTLTREVILIEVPQSWGQHSSGDRPSLGAMVLAARKDYANTFPYAFMVYPNQLNAALDEIHISLSNLLPITDRNRTVSMPRTRSLPVGARVRVKYTFMEHDPNPFTADLTRVKTMVRIECIGGEWPSVLTAIFNNSDRVGRDGDWFTGILQPAPWERTGSPTSLRRAILSEWCNSKNYVGKVQHPW